MEFIRDTILCYHHSLQRDAFAFVENDDSKIFGYPLASNLSALNNHFATGVATLP